MVRIEAQFVGELRVIEERILGDILHDAHFIRLAEGVAGEILLAQFQVAVGHVVGRHLRQRIGAVGHQVEFVHRLAAIAGAVVGVAEHVAIAAFHAHALRALFHEGKRLLVPALAVVRFTGKPVDLVHALGAFGILEQRFHIGVQLLVFSLLVQDLRDVIGHHLLEVLIAFQALEHR